MDKQSIVIEQFKSKPRHEQDIVLSQANRESLRQGSLFLSAGQVSHCAGYILEGVIRIYHMNGEGEQRTLGFAAEKNFIIDMDSYRNRSPSLRNWEAVTDVTMLIWERDAMKNITQTFPHWNTLMDDLVHKALYDRTIELFEMLEDNATTRYQKFINRYPHIVSRVSLRHIANYLGIAPQSLSRIRQQLINVDRKSNK